MDLTARRIARRVDIGRTSYGVRSWAGACRNHALGPLLSQCQNSTGLVRFCQYASINHLPVLTSLRRSVRDTDVTTASFRSLKGAAWRVDVKSPQGLSVS